MMIEAGVILLESLPTEVAYLDFPPFMSGFLEQEVLDYSELKGFAWGNFFSHALVKKFGLEAMKEVPGCTVRELSSGYFYRLSPDLRKAPKKETIETVRKLFPDCLVITDWWHRDPVVI